MTHLSKEEVRGPDTFISTADRFGRWIMKHQKSFLSFLVIIGLGGLGYLAVDGYINYSEKKSAQRLFEYQQRLLAKQEEWSLQVRNKMENLNKDTKAAGSKGWEEVAATVPKPDYNVAYAPLVAEYEKGIEKERGSKASLVHTSELAGFLSEEKRSGEAVTLLKKMLSGIEPRSLLETLLFTQLGTALASQNQWEEASQIFEKTLKSPSVSTVKPELLLKLGLCYEGLQNLGKAKEYLTLARDQFGSTQAGRAAKNYLRMMMLKESQTGG